MSTLPSIQDAIEDMEALKTKDEIKYRNKKITDMTRDELIEALTFAVNEIQRLYSDITKQYIRRHENN